MVKSLMKIVMASERGDLPQRILNMILWGLLRGKERPSPIKIPGVNQLHSLCRYLLWFT